MTTEATGLADLAVRPYRPRPLRFLRQERAGEWRLKLYGIAMPGQQVRPALVDATAALAAKVLPQPALGEGRYGTGFAIAQDAASACFGLVYWWQAQNELHGRAYGAPFDRPHDLQPIAQPDIGCVWVLGIIDFERRAWLEDVLANPAGADLDRYMGRRLDADL